MSWEALLAEARAGARLVASPMHGEAHWRAVAGVGAALAARDPRLDAPLLLAFGILHDCRRVSETRDPHHGARSAEVARGSATLAALIGEAGQARVAQACAVHNGTPRVHAADDATVAACLDADRYTLDRVGIRPDRRYLSLDPDDAAYAALRALGQALSDAPPAWSQLFAEVRP